MHKTTLRYSNSEGCRHPTARVSEEINKIKKETETSAGVSSEGNLKRFKRARVLRLLEQSWSPPPQNRERHDKKA